MSKNPAVLRSKKITVEFSGFKAINELDFQVNRNTVHFVIGPNGAGKTTLLDVICGNARASKGSITFNEKYELAKMSENEIVHRGISRKFQAPSVFAHLTVFENLEIAMKQKKTLRSILRAKMTKEEEQKLTDMLDLIGLTSEKDKSAGSLAHGQKQWLEIAMVLMQEPDLVLLDEPIAGMSKQERIKTGELITKIAKERAVLIVEHDMDFVKDYADVVTVMHEGQLLFEGSMEDVQKDPKVREVYLGRKVDADAEVTGT
ncbi:urea ABC transporter ATP-binding protein UrtD [Aquibacillus koreensis]|uniref:Urea ABC transporter ATP-binding protein UrtD n=1 Tax=Aquibacillus koreensis TaxID=279446 RepID=A0A9X3WPM6_9BACI|nr:urea ABC transporter ATP-binding protein UrtD [Aquibacillus koreensis]MCT2534171.1 urea ABC transporter ATP-binding protein UrtD [Aquibacillus koreensis]MDC3422563.1 urea ABC transporter ATP-binding protein UrtD [Aquibacillus koreensis]